ncbi:hypothetical protein E4U25_007763 [Claviceps purpurea]|nr:hypothetical protein E4U25_007763 [Claviceps purpurea]
MWHGTDDLEAEPRKLMTEAVGESIDVEMIDSTAPAEAPIVEEPLAETQPLEEITANRQILNHR